MSHATLSTIIDPQVKAALTAFCRKRGLKVRHVVEQALVEQLEDEIDLEAYHQRRSEVTIPLETLLSARRRRKTRE